MNPQESRQKCSLCSSCPLYKWFPFKYIIKYIPSFITGFILMLIDMQSRRWKGLELHLIVRYILLSSILSLIFSLILEYFSLMKLED